MAMVSRNRLEHDKDNLRREIMGAGREFFVAFGYDNVSMRKIADKIGYSPTTIYLYFKDKSDLLHQICEESFTQLARNVSAIQQLSASPLEKLRMGMREYIHFGLQHPSHYEIVFIMPKQTENKGGFENSQGATAFAVLRAGVSACVEANTFTIKDIELISQTLWAGLHGVTSLLIKHPGFPFVEPDRLIDSVIDTLITGFRA